MSTPTRSSGTICLASPQVAANHSPASPFAVLVTPPRATSATAKGTSGAEGNASAAVAVAPPTVAARPGDNPTYRTIATASTSAARPVSIHLALYTAAPAAPAPR